jgi:putative inorganic carbon (HCO3(-)) transporter
MFLNIAAEVGLPGLLVFLALFLWHFSLAFRALRTAGAAGQKACAIGLCAMFFGVFVGGLTDYPLFNLEIASIFWLLSAMTFVLWRQSGGKCSGASK